MTINGRFMLDNQFLAQAGHFLFAACAVFYAIAVTHEWKYGLINSILMMAYALPKETVIDPATENDPFFWSGAVDLTFYILGLSVAWGLLYLARYGV